MQAGISYFVKCFFTFSCIFIATVLSSQTHAQVNQKGERIEIYKMYLQKSMVEYYYTVYQVEYNEQISFFGSNLRKHMVDCPEAIKHMKSYSACGKGIVFSWLVSIAGAIGYAGNIRPSVSNPRTSNTDMIVYTSGAAFGAGVLSYIILTGYKPTYLFKAAAEYNKFYNSQHPKTGSLNIVPSELGFIPGNGVFNQNRIRVVWNF